MGAPVGEFLYKLENDEETYLLFYCPGCETTHPYIIRATDPGRPQWTYNGDPQSPSFSPSLLVNQHTSEKRCHLFVEDGKIRFLNDCHHELRGQTVALPEYPAG